MVISPEETAKNLPELARTTALNCIDISSSDIRHSVSLLKQACLESGFFYVINHGISQEFMEEVFEQSKRFFGLPLQEKMMLLRNEKNRGYTPILDEHLDPVNQVHGDYKEGFYIGVDVPEGNPEAEKPFYGPNLWPKDDILHGWRETMERYHREALQVARKVARILALALDLDVDFFNKPEVLGKAIATLRLLHYEGHISEPTKGIYGAGAHTDFGMLTLLATDDVIGLQICRDKNVEHRVWEYIPPLKGAFIVNIGDMLERWSNCCLSSTLHRVLGNGQERYSVSPPKLSFYWDTASRIIKFPGKHHDNAIAFFVSPSHDCNIECLPTCQSEDNPPKLPPVKSGAYLLQRYAETHADLSSYK